MEPQYDPNNDFAIFGVGDHRVGGVQDMTQKMNMAEKADSSSEEEDPQHKIPDHKQSTEEPSSGTKLSSRSSEKLPEDQEIHEVEEI